MIKISKKSQYGLRAMIYLAKNYKSKQVCSTKTISEKEGIPFDFLEKILSDLEKAKLIKSKKGIGGGYVLAENPKKITAEQIVKILERTITPVNCLLCDRSEKCMSKNVWRKIDKTIKKTLKSITLAELIK